MKSDKQLSRWANIRLTQLTDHLEGGILIEDEQRRIVLVNQPFCDLFNIPTMPESLTGMDCSGSAESSKTLFADPELFVRRIETILSECQNVTGEVLHLADGRVFTRDYVVLFDDDVHIGHLWHYRDTTAALQATYRLERLLQFEAINKDVIRLFLQLDNISNAVNKALKLTGELLDVSRSYVFRLRENDLILDNTHEWCAPGIQPEIGNLQGIPFDDLLPSFFPMMAENDLIAPSHISELPDDLRAILEPQDIHSVLWVPFYLNDRIEGFIGYDETRHARQWLPEEITVARIVAEGHARALEREHAEQSLIAARDEAIRTANLRAQFVANMSHEIRTPMTGVLGMLELLLETELNELQHEFANGAFESSARLLTIINEILDFSKLDAGQIVLEAKPIDLRGIVKEVNMTLAPQLRDKPVEILIEISDNIPYRVYGDATRIRQVLMNLVGNAIKFTNKGRITLAVELHYIRQDVAYVRFAVRDTGIGIAPKDIGRIFDSFTQADGSITRKHGGSGLGLSISKQLVELMNGTLETESEVNAGSVFHFVLPLPIAQMTGAEVVENDFRNLRVILVDPKRTARHILSQQLENWSVQVIAMADIEAISDARIDVTRPVDLILCRVTSKTLSHETLQRYARHVAYITDKDHEIDNGVSYLQWPIMQSHLYNLLMRVSRHNVSDSALFGERTPGPDVDDKQKRVLVADDYALTLNLVTRALKNMNINVDCATNGEEALNLLEKGNYDLVLMDMQMPVLNGIEATKRIRGSSAHYRNVPIIAFTADLMASKRRQYEAIGINEIISKPFNVSHLRRVVMQWLSDTNPDSDTS